MVHVGGLYPNIPHDEEGLSAVKLGLDRQMEKYISSDILGDLTEVVMKNNIVKFLKQKKRACNRIEMRTSL